MITLYMRWPFSADGWMASAQTARWFMAVRSPRYPKVWSERELLRFRGWRLTWKRKKAIEQ